MRSALLTLLTCALGVPPVQQSSGAFFPVGIDYPPDARTSSSEIARDLQAVRAAGFNSIRTAVSWREGEPAPGEYRFDPLRRVLEVAARAGVRVLLQIERAAPVWVVARYPAGERKAEPVPGGRDCHDHAGLRADRIRFVTAIARDAARFPSLLAVDVGRSTGDDPCLAELVGAARRELPPDVSVDRVGIRVDASMSASALGARFDEIAAASPRGWWLDLGAIPEPDRRFAAWMAISRGAQGLIFDDPPQDAGFIRTIAGNPALFTQVRPRRRGDARIDGGSDIEVRFLESATVQMIVAFNHAGRAQRVTMTFPPETQEAIWLNMETGTSVNFVAGPLGPLYQYWFRPKDVLVLMIRKDIR